MEIVATRELELLNGLDSYSKVSIVVFKPVPAENGGYRCNVAIEGLVGDGMPPIVGEDSMQALILAIAALRHYLAHSEENRQGRLKWLGMSDLGLSFSV
jgi:hypothetical protein